MNIFFLDTDLEKLAAAHCDQHLVKMVLETAQIASTAATALGVEFEGRYSAGHKHHPCCVWAGESLQNLLHTCRVGIALSAEYSWRYGRTHASSRVILSCVSQIPKSLPWPDLYPVAIKTELRRESYAPRLPLAQAVEEYRAYYMADKARFATWRCSPPAWWTL